MQHKNAHKRTIFYFKPREEAGGGNVGLKPIQIGIILYI